MEPNKWNEQSARQSIEGPRQPAHQRRDSMSPGRDHPRGRQHSHYRERSYTGNSHQAPTPHQSRSRHSRTDGNLDLEGGLLSSNGGDFRHMRPSPRDEHREDSYISARSGQPPMSSLPHYASQMSETPQRSNMDNPPFQQTMGGRSDGSRRASTTTLATAMSHFNNARQTSTPRHLQSLAPEQPDHSRYGSSTVRVSRPIDERLVEHDNRAHVACQRQPGYPASLYDTQADGDHYTERSSDYTRTPTIQPVGVDMRDMIPQQTQVLRSVEENSSVGRPGSVESGDGDSVKSESSASIRPGQGSGHIDTLDVNRFDLVPLSMSKRMQQRVRRADAWWREVQPLVEQGPSAFSRLFTCDFTMEVDTDMSFGWWNVHPLLLCVPFLGDRIQKSTIATAWRERGQQIKSVEVGPILERVDVQSIIAANGKVAHDDMPAQPPILTCRNKTCMLPQHMLIPSLTPPWEDNCPLIHEYPAGSTVIPLKCPGLPGQPCPYRPASAVISEQETFLACWLYSHGHTSLGRATLRELTADGIPDDLLDANLRLFKVGIDKEQKPVRCYAFLDREVRFRDYIADRIAKSSHLPMLPPGQNGTEIQESPPAEVARGRQSVSPTETNAQDGAGLRASQGSSWNNRGSPARHTPSMASCGQHTASTPSASPRSRDGPPGRVTPPHRFRSHIPDSSPSMSGFSTHTAPLYHDGLGEHIRSPMRQRGGFGDDMRDSKRPDSTSADMVASQVQGDEEHDSTATSPLPAVCRLPAADSDLVQSGAISPQGRQRSYTPGMTDQEITDMVDEAVALLQSTNRRRPLVKYQGRLGEIQMISLDFWTSHDSDQFFELARQAGGWGNEFIPICPLCYGPYHTRLPEERRVPQPFSLAGSRAPGTIALVSHLQKHIQAEEVKAKALRVTIENVPWLRKSMTYRGSLGRQQLTVDLKTGAEFEERHSFHDVMQTLARGRIPALK